jgi:hypothetical protein
LLTDGIKPANFTARSGHDGATMRAPTRVWRISGPRLHSTRDSFENQDPHGGIIQAAITTAVATAIATHHLTDFNMRFVEEWFFAWGISFLTMLPVVIFVAPFIQRCVLALTLSTGGDGLN